MPVLSVYARLQPAADAEEGQPVPGGSCFPNLERFLEETAQDNKLKAAFDICFYAVIFGFGTRNGLAP